MNSIFIILLGCNIYSILINRLETSFKHIESRYSNSNQPTKITWFLSGGIKNNFPGAKTEASIMKSKIDNIINLKYVLTDSKLTWDFVIDDKSTNTAENFIRASEYLNDTTVTNNYDSVYIVTSDFHYNRANLMVGLIDSSRQYDWILGEIEQSDSRYWESIHIKNVYDDVNKAINLMSNV